MGRVSNCFFYYLESKDFPANPPKIPLMFSWPVRSCDYSPASRETRKAGLGFLASVAKLLSCLREGDGQWAVPTTVLFRALCPRLVLLLWGLPL